MPNVKVDDLDALLPQMGDCLAKYRGTLARNPLHLPGLVVGIGFLGFVLYTLLAAREPLTSGAQFGVLLVVSCLGYLLYLLYRAVVGSNSDLFLFERGLLSRRGGRLTLLAWDDVTAVVEHVTVHQMRDGPVTRVAHHMRLRQRDGEELKLDLSFLPDSDEASLIVHGATLPRLAEHAAAKLTAGEKVAFGEHLAVGPDGLHQTGEFGGKHFLPWESLREFKLEEGWVLVKSDKDKLVSWFSRQLEEMPNARVLMVLLDHKKNGAALPALVA